MASVKSIKDIISQLSRSTPSAPSFLSYNLTVTHREHRQRKRLKQTDTLLFAIKHLCESFSFLWNGSSRWLNSDSSWSHSLFSFLYKAIIVCLSKIQEEVGLKKTIWWRAKRRRQTARGSERVKCLGEREGGRARIARVKGQPVSTYTVQSCHTPPTKPHRHPVRWVNEWVSVWASEWDSER